ncbi:MAG TPA: YihY/virulence factor BrkB family protein [Alphaproteobacteria bacterium]|nr:YihY/virulence factor BrkB family protein [Alphaproteobacteria bacterium]
MQMSFPTKVKRIVAMITHWVGNSSLVDNSVVALGWRVFKELGDDDATHLSAGVAYYSVFSVFPLLLGLLAISGTVFTSITLQEQFLDYVTESMPGSEEFVSKNIEELVRFRGALGIGAILGLLWSGSSAFGAMSRAINRAWDVEKDRPFYVAKTLHIIIALSVGILFLLSSFASVAIELLSNYSRDLGLPGHEFFLDFGLGNLMLKAVPWAITLAVFLLLYRFVPNCKTYWRYVWTGAVVATILFEASKGIFMWYLVNVANYELIYGSVASMMVLMSWAYVSAFILILGAEISSEYGRMRNGIDRGQF